MKPKRPPTLKQLFNAWLKYQKKNNELTTARYFANKLARQIEGGETELIEHDKIIYRITVNLYNVHGYKVEQVATAAELPVKN